MSHQRIPQLTLPTNDYGQMQSMSNRRLISVLREAVLSPERAYRFSPRPPETHDAYTVCHRPGCIDIHLHEDGTEIFCCKFVPAGDY